ncbi:hypothetical protein LCGC14_2734010 [marine sediment metagenome]|uniref:Uncharacterized protein n=1 Tax=marine sediment metagenome TaxID=412755 RepID=A0A0F9BFE9_9ZZZZ
MEEIKKTITMPSIALKMNSKGYGWDIRISNDDLDKAVEEVERINNLMLKKFKKRGGH